MPLIESTKLVHEQKHVTINEYIFAEILSMISIDVRGPRGGQIAYLNIPRDDLATNISLFNFLVCLKPVLDLNQLEVFFSRIYCPHTTRNKFVTWVGLAEVILPVLTYLMIKYKGKGL